MVAVAMMCGRRIWFSCLLVHLIDGDLTGDLEEGDNCLVVAPLEC
jgi:hypothetical protein